MFAWKFQLFYNKNDLCFIAEKHLEHTFSLLALFIIGVWWFHLVLSKFQKTEILLRSISNTRFHYKHFLLWVCDDLNLFSANFRKLKFCWEAFWHLFSLQTLLIISLFCSVMFWACSQQILENWDFTEKCFEHSFSLQTLFIMGLWWFELVLSKFQKTEKRFEHFFFITDTSYYQPVLIWACSQQILENWDFAEKRFKQLYSLC